MSCIPCEQKRQRLEYKRNAVKERAIEWARSQNLREVVVFLPEEGDEAYSFGATFPPGAAGIEFFLVPALDV